MGFLQGLSRRAGQRPWSPSSPHAVSSLRATIANASALRAARIGPPAAREAPPARSAPRPRRRRRLRGPRRDRGPPAKAVSRGCPPSARRAFAPSGTGAMDKARATPPPPRHAWSPVTANKPADHATRGRAGFQCRPPGRFSVSIDSREGRRPGGLPRQAPRTRLARRGAGGRRQGRRKPPRRFGGSPPQAPARQRAPTRRSGGAPGWPGFSRTARLPCPACALAAETRGDWIEASRRLSMGASKALGKPILLAQLDAHNRPGAGAPTSRRPQAPDPCPPPARVGRARKGPSAPLGPASRGKTAQAKGVYRRRRVRLRASPSAKPGLPGPGAASPTEGRTPPAGHHRTVMVKERLSASPGV